MSKKTRRDNLAERQRTTARPSIRPTQRQSTRGVPLNWAAAILAVMIVVGAFVYYSRDTSSGGTAVAATADLGKLTSSKPSGATGSFEHVSIPYLQGKKPVLLYIGAEWCPFCAAERWPIVKALARFGTWSGLTTGQSTSGKGGFGVIPSYGFTKASYSSPYVAFDGKEVADNSGATLQSLSPDEQSIMNRYDGAGSIPMVYVDGYVMVGAGYSPTEIQGRAFSYVQGLLQKNSGDAAVDHVNAEANLLTAFLCRADGQQPHAVCDNATIRAIGKGLQ